jgi:putative FmdB family regulatory protein
MPTYDYSCDDCGHRFEAFQAMSEEPLSICPECNGRVRRLITGGSGIIFKGSGFYVTDNKKSAPTGAGTAEAAKADKSAGEKSIGEKGSGDNGSSKGEEKKESGKKEPAASKA